ncbi:glycosyl transferase family 90-domain-containing protein [Roridomyces roridus]|uniref:Glycosyl transferase family 90-domain-containing protein n=1 Tax=Roridomyces roridus TaxID=1738132 RepID=A0AAD7FPM6_9AGAR|nr:glycosyl transferase family 90-domain-containing protein [Roridomyces roridus]
MKTPRQLALLAVLVFTAVTLQFSWQVYPTSQGSWAGGPQAKHTFRDDGLIELNPLGNHPIFELISRAQDAWQDKLDRASTTLPEAVREYRRRYGRNPPKGFDVWWNYVREHNVQLPDEYDQIYRDLEPFWGIDPKDLDVMRSELEGKVDSYTVGKNATGNLSILNYSLTPGAEDHLLIGARGMIRLLESVQHLLPAFRAVVSPQDPPNRLTDFFVYDAALQAAADNRVLNRGQFPAVNSTGWTSACGPGSPARELDLEGSLPEKATQGPTFIYDHKLAMDPCLHPRHFWQHGIFIWEGKGPNPRRELFPEFSYTSSPVHHNIRIPTLYLWVEDILPRSDDPEWEDKPDHRLLWRGSTTGMTQPGERADTATRLRKSHRVRLIEFVNDLKGMLSILPSVKSQSERIGEPLQVPMSRVNPAVMDIAFAGSPMLCDAELCSVLGKMHFQKSQSLREAGDYKYVSDVDGNGWSGRFQRLLISNSLIFKSTIYPDWYTDRIAPWVHYVPVQLDLSDLHNALLFFRGSDISGVDAHDELARQIASAGRRWAKEFWRTEDMIAYFFRLLLEYARVMSEDREAMTFHI